MTYAQMWDKAYEILKDEAYAFCHYMFNKGAPQLKSDKTDAPNDVIEKFESIIKRLEDNEPMQYIFGYTPFYNIDVLCEPGVLIPRYDTEIIVEQAIKRIKPGGYFADICCGSGCIALAVLYNRPDLNALCLDISDKALELTAKNLKKYGLDNRCNVKKFDVFGQWDDLPVFDFILCNPPYINGTDMKKLPENVKKEPYEALYGGEDGLDFYRRIKDASRGHLAKEAHIIFEIGYDQAEALKGLFTGCEIIKDLSGNDRAAII